MKFALNALAIAIAVAASAAEPKRDLVSGERTLRAYANDPRRAYANHAAQVLSKR